MKFSTKKITCIPPNPMIAVIGAQPYRSKIATQLLTQVDFFSKKYGRIIYIGEKKYKSDIIIQDHTNHLSLASYEQIMNFLDLAKMDQIVNLLFVFNCKDIKIYEDIIDKLFGVRFTYLKGSISIMICLLTPLSINKETLSKFNIIFYTDTEHLKELAQMKETKGVLPEKRKKDTYVITQKFIEVYKSITD